MKRPSFFEGVGVALVASIVISAGVFVIGAMFVSAGLLQMMIALLSAAYISYLMIRSRERLGRLTVFAIWLGATLLSGVFAPSLVIFALVQLGMIWIIRSLYYYNSVLAALADLGLIGLSMLAGMWAWFNTQSLFLAVWCFFLVQALFVYIPKQLKSSNTKDTHAHHASDRFQQAYLAAEQAARQLSLKQSKP
jgi:hypothetical protein